jgi:hypothetical protein
MTAGRDNPLIVNRELSEVAAVTVTFAPLAFRLPEAVPELPTTTLPMANDAGVTVSCPDVRVPLPLNGRDELASLAAMVTFPLALPADCGANVTARLVLCPAAIVRGVEIEPIENPVPVIAICEMVRLAPPVFVSVSDNCCWVPTFTVPKSRLVELRVREPTCAGCVVDAACFAELNPWQPTVKARATEISPTLRKELIVERVAVQRLSIVASRGGYLQLNRLVTHLH